MKIERERESQDRRAMVGCIVVGGTQGQGVAEVEPPQLPEVVEVEPHQLPEVAEVEPP